MPVRTFPNRPLANASVLEEEELDITNSPVAEDYNLKRKRILRWLIATPPPAQPEYRPSPMPPRVDPTDSRALYPHTPNEIKHRKRTTSVQPKILKGILK
ncbi:hypothetical protein DFH09DRAFT_953254, partial [Mycena vulgaris]